MKAGYWQTIAAICGLIIGVGSAIAAHFNGLSEAKKYADERVQAYRTEVTPLLIDIQAKLQKVEIDTAVIKERVTRTSGRQDEGKPVAARRD